MSANSTHSPRIQSHRGARREEVAAGECSISTLALLQFCGLLLMALPGAAQDWDIGGRLADYVPSHTGASGSAAAIVSRLRS